MDAVVCRISSYSTKLNDSISGSKKILKQAWKLCRIVNNLFKVFSQIYDNIWPFLVFTVSAQVELLVQLIVSCQQLFIPWFSFTIGEMCLFTRQSGLCIEMFYLCCHTQQRHSLQHYHNNPLGSIQIADSHFTLEPTLNNIVIHAVELYILTLNLSVHLFLSLGDIPKIGVWDSSFEIPCVKLKLLVNNSCRLLQWLLLLA